jgi:hypothetical protein
MQKWTWGEERPLENIINDFRCYRKCNEVCFTKMNNKAMLITKPIALTPKDPWVFWYKTTQNYPFWKKDM